MTRRYNDDGTPQIVPRWAAYVGLAILAGVTLCVVILAVVNRP
jgi:hypothetical protein